jgi:hypothetical protein
MRSDDGGLHRSSQGKAFEKNGTGFMQSNPPCRRKKG